jgi:hypothetical protein
MISKSGNWYWFIDINLTISLTLIFLAHIHLCGCSILYHVYFYVTTTTEIQISPLSQNRLYLCIVTSPCSHSLFPGISISVTTLRMLYVKNNHSIEYFDSFFFIPSINSLRSIQVASGSFFLLLNIQLYECASLFIWAWECPHLGDKLHSPPAK